MTTSLAIIGLGLIGASVARGVRQAMPDCRIIGWDLDAETCTRALALGIIDRAGSDVEDAATDADLVVVATPVRSIAALVASALAAAPAAAVTDTGSVKGAIVSALQADGIDTQRFVPGHPVAGSERFGVEAGDAELFRGRRVILTPHPGTSPDALSKVRALWEALGARIDCMSAQHHDEVLAATSHLPHALAYALVDCLNALDERREIFAFAAGGFRDFTRIASSSPTMWRDILLENREALDPMLRRFSDTLEQLRSALNAGDEAVVLATLMRARSARQRFLSLMESTESNSDAVKES